jgi:hypothetical protein
MPTKISLILNFLAIAIEFLIAKLHDHIKIAKLTTIPIKL